MSSTSSPADAAARAAVVEALADELHGAWSTRRTVPDTSGTTSDLSVLT